jgi:hypothetical protein
VIAMSNLEEFAQAVGRDVKSLNQKPEPRLTLTGNTLGIVGGNNVTLPLPENVGHEIRGTGSPEGRITAEIGTTYVDVNVTNGALKWIKESGNGNTGWKVLIGDTGWRTLNNVSRVENAFIKVRRMNNQILYNLDGLGWGIFEIVSRGSEKFRIQGSTYGVRILEPGGIPFGFRSESSFSTAVFNDSGSFVGSCYVGGEGESNFMELKFNNGIPNDNDITDLRVSLISYLTDDPWPTTLP